MVLTKLPEYLMTGGSCVMLRCARLFCVAPVRFEKRQNGYKVTMSPRLNILNIMLITVCNLLSMTGLAVDLYADPDRSTRAQSSTRLLVWVTELLASMLIGSIAVYNGNKRTSVVLYSLHRTEEINRIIAKEKGVLCTDRNTKAILFVSYTIPSVLVLIDYLLFLVLTIQNDRDLNSALIYFFYHILYLIANAFLIQCAFTVSEVCYTLNKYNDILEDVTLCSISIYNDAIIPQLEVKESLNFKLLSPLTQGTMGNSRPPEENIRRLALMYDNICDIVKGLDDSFGFGSLVIVISTLMRLVVTPYNTIVNIRGNVANPPLLVLQLVWLIVHTLCVITVIEPCHRTHQEMSRTRSLVGKLILKSKKEPVYKELEKFWRYLTLNKVNYVPMGICTLSRSLVATIAGSVATYLVIICQFQGPDKGEF